MQGSAERGAAGPDAPPPGVDRGRPGADPASLGALVRAGLAGASLSVDAAAVERLTRFISILLGARAELRLSTIRDPAEAVQRQVVEPLTGWRAIAGRVPAGPLVEVGAGGGAPGVPIAIAWGERAVTLVETRERRAGYLRALAEELGLSNVSVVQERGEVFGGRTGAGREQFAGALGRALARLPVALELLLPLVRVGGVAVVYGGPSAEGLLGEAGVVATALGGERPEAEAVSWPGAPVRLAMVTCRKLAMTPDRFPRRVRQMRKVPPS